MKIVLLLSLTECAFGYLRKRSLSLVPKVRLPRVLQSNASTVTPWYDLGMSDSVLNEVTVYYLGQTWYKGADIGEVLSTVRRVTDDGWSWTMEWRQTAARLEALAEESLQGGQ